MFGLTKRVGTYDDVALTPLANNFVHAKSLVVCSGSLPLADVLTASAKVVEPSRVRMGTPLEKSNDPFFKLLKQVFEIYTAPSGSFVLMFRRLLPSISVFFNWTYSSFLRTKSGKGINALTSLYVASSFQNRRAPESTASHVGSASSLSHCSSSSAGCPLDILENIKGRKRLGKQHEEPASKDTECKEDNIEEP